MKLLDLFENMFLANHSCICCFKEIPDETKFMLCDDCEDKMNYLSGNLCSKCGDKLTLGGNCVNNCKTNRYLFRSNVSLCHYVDSAAKIIKNLKYGNKKYLAKYVADMMIAMVSKFKDLDIITFVPASKTRIKSRGFNQAEEIAIHIGESLNIEVRKLLIKTKETTHQAGGTQKDRMKNLEDSFAINEEFEDEIENKNILIIDDVFTTGSTLNECTKTLKKKNPKCVYCATFAKTKFNINAQN